MESGTWSKHFQHTVDIIEQPNSSSSILHRGCNIVHRSLFSKGLNSCSRPIVLFKNQLFTTHLRYSSKQLCLLKLPAFQPFLTPLKHIQFYHLKQAFDVLYKRIKNILLWCFGTYNLQKFYRTQYANNTAKTFNVFEREENIMKRRNILYLIHG